MRAQSTHGVVVLLLIDQQRYRACFIQGFLHAASLPNIRRLRMCCVQSLRLSQKFTDRIHNSRCVKLRAALGCSEVGWQAHLHAVFAVTRAVSTRLEVDQTSKYPQIIETTHFPPCYALRCTKLTSSSRVESRVAQLIDRTASAILAA